MEERTRQNYFNWTVKAILEHVSYCFGSNFIMFIWANRKVDDMWRWDFNTSKQHIQHFWDKCWHLLTHTSTHTHTERERDKVRTASSTHIYICTTSLLSPLPTYLLVILCYSVLIVSIGLLSKQAINQNKKWNHPPFYKNTLTLKHFKC